MKIRNVAVSQAMLVLSLAVSAVAVCFETPNPPGSAFSTGDNSLDCATATFSDSLEDSLYAAMAKLGYVSKDGADDCARSFTDSQDFGHSWFGVPVCTWKWHEVNPPSPAVQAYLDNNVRSGFQSIDGVLLALTIVIGLTLIGCVVRCMRKHQGESADPLLSAETGERPGYGTVDTDKNHPSAPSADGENDEEGESDEESALQPGAAGY